MTAVEMAMEARMEMMSLKRTSRLYKATRSSTALPTDVVLKCTVWCSWLHENGLKHMGSGKDGSIDSSEISR